MFMEGEKLEQVKLTHLGSYITAKGSIAEEIFAGIAKIQAAFPNLRHL